MFKAASGEYWLRLDRAAEKASLGVLRAHCAHVKVI